MGKYTDFLEYQAINIDPDDDNYFEQLTEIAKSFRSFGEALDSFIVLKGYEGDINDIKTKTDCKCQVKMYNFGGLKCTISF